MSPKFFIVLLIQIIFFLKCKVYGHGMMLEPPNRSSLWRFPEFQRYNPIENFNDNENYCGGFDKQYKENEGRCGVCGDDFKQPQPRDNEGGGMYGSGVIVRKYKTGQLMDVVVNLTTTHAGHFEFKICPQNNPYYPTNQSCLDQNPLFLKNGVGKKVFVLIKGPPALFSGQVRLPPNLQCSHCVVQWSYITANSWGVCEDGKEGLGCGNQEMFRGCSDISIVSNSQQRPPRPPKRKPKFLHKNYLNQRQFYF